MNKRTKKYFKKPKETTGKNRGLKTKGNIKKTIEKRKWLNNIQSMQEANPYPLKKGLKY